MSAPPAKKAAMGEVCCPAQLGQGLGSTSCRQAWQGAARLAAAPVLAGLQERILTLGGEGFWVTEVEQAGGKGQLHTAVLGLRVS